MNLVAVVITSFGYRHAPAPEADITVDVRRLLRDPLWVKGLRQLTGHDPAIVRHVTSTPGAIALAANTAKTVADLADQVGDPRSELTTVAIGCAGGRHRSVALAEMVADAIRDRGHRVEVIHRDVSRPVLASA